MPLSIERRGLEQEEPEATQQLPGTMTEQTPLLSGDVLLDNRHSKAGSRRVIIMCALLLFVVDVGANIMEPPTNQLMEDVICRDYFSDHALGKEGLMDHRCKERMVQKDFTALKSVNMFARTLCPLLVQIPFGVVADKYGRTTVLVTAISGVLMSAVSGATILHFPNVFPSWSLPISHVFLLLGGGGPMLNVMLFTIIADVTPVSERAAVFYQMMALSVILSAIFGPFSAWLMSKDPWLAVFLGVFIMFLGLVTSVFVPETKDYRVTSDFSTLSNDLAAEPAVNQTSRKGLKSTVIRSLRACRTDMVLVWRYVLGSPQIMLLVFCEALFVPVATGLTTFGVQSITVRFGWNWSKATYVASVSSITSCIVLLTVLPLVSLLVTKFTAIHPLNRDLQLVRVSSLVSTLGLLLFAFADSFSVLVLAMVVIGLSAGYTSQVRSIITSLVEPHMLATVNTTMSTFGTLLALGATPLVGWLFSKGLDLGGLWTGLLFVVLALVALLVSVVLCFLRIPRSAIEVEERLQT